MHKRVMIIILCIITFLTLVACPPRMPCDEKIKHPVIIEEEVLNNPVIQQINSELTLLEINIGPCFVNNKVGVGIIYELPKSYSEFQLSYKDSLVLAYDKDGTLVISGGIKQPEAFEVEVVLSYFKGIVQEIESNPRIREFILKTEPDPRNPSIALYSQKIIRFGGSQVDINYRDGSVRGYMLSNDIDWHEFPEIKVAHQVIEEHLLVGEYSNCSIGHGEHHGYTAAQFHDSLTSPWFLTVAIKCNKDLKDALIHINSDGSYDRLEFQYEPKN